MNQPALFEHRFWLQILGDHSRFILNTLSPKETEDIQISKQFIQAFDQLLEQARSSSSEANISTLTQQSLQLTNQLRMFKLNILQRILLNQITIGLTATFVNHMLNELEEYLRILNALAAGQSVPHFPALHHDLLWLLDAIGHSAVIASDLDLVEKKLIEKSQIFEKHFQQLYLKSIEMVGYMRTQLPDFPAFRRFHNEIELEMKLFIIFLRELLEMELSAEVLDRIAPLIPDHMMREECYYLTKIASLGLVQDPNCDPTKQRIEG